MHTNTSRNLCLLAVVLWILAAISVFTIDTAAAQFDVNDFPGELRRLVELSEAFAHGMGVAMILITLFVVDPTKRTLIPRVAVVAFLPGIIANAGKLLVTRHRPRDFDTDQVALESFAGFPGTTVSSNLQSFPSGHTATAVGLAIGLTCLYPQGRYVFAVLAILAASQRVLFDAHFVSDTFAGAGIACLVAGVICNRLFWGTQPVV